MFSPVSPHSVSCNQASRCLISRESADRLRAADTVTDTKGRCVDDKVHSYNFSLPRADSFIFIIRQSSASYRGINIIHWRMSVIKALIRTLIYLSRIIPERQ